MRNSAEKLSHKITHIHINSTGAAYFKSLKSKINFKTRV